MAKTELTKQLERNIILKVRKQGLFCCFEVTIGWFGKERVDFITFDTKGIWRCYEIKVSKADFFSKAKNTFIGNYNYYVMPRALYEIVKKDIPDDIGVYIDGTDLVKKSKRRELGVEEEILKHSLIRSLYRESEKIILGEMPNVLEHYKKRIKYLEGSNEEIKRKYYTLKSGVINEYGSRALRELEQREIGKENT